MIQRHDIELACGMKDAARNAGIHPTTLFGWIKQSLADDPKMILTWLGHEAPFHCAA